LRKKEIEAQANAVAIEASDQYQEEKKPDYSDASAYIIYDADMADKFKRFYEENAIFHIKYQKYGGEISERDIELKSVEIGVFDEPSYIRAFCFLREAERDFRLDRIITLSVNGEDVENPELFFVRLHYNSPEYKIKMAFTEHQNEIMLLIFFARADGIMRKNERGIITRYFNEFVDGIPSNYTDSYLKQLQCELSLTTIVRRAKSMNATTKARLLDTVSQIYALKKSPSKIEEGVFEKLKKALSG
jgi:hypothetical protein